MIVLVMIELAIALSYMLITNMLFLSVLQYSVHDFWQLSVHNIRLPKQSTVGDVIVELKDKVELSSPKAELRILEVFYHKIYKIFPLNEKIENINDQYWTLRAEEVDIKIQFSVNTSELSCVLHCQISVFAHPNGLSVCIVLIE
jgi:hypothetical protein